MNISDSLRCLYSASIEEQDDAYVIRVPEHELDLGSLQEGRTYRVAVLSAVETEADDRSTANQPGRAEPATDHGEPTPPVEEGETRTVEIENIGDQGDGIARVERGFVVIVPDTEEGERVRVEITDVRQNVAFADVTERMSYYD